MWGSFTDGLDWLTGQILAGESFLILLVIYLLMILTERCLAAWLRDDRRDVRSDLSNAAVSALPAIVSALGVGALFVGLYQMVYQFRLFDVPGDRIWAWALVFLVHEFCYYLDHRLAHRIGFFWAFHQVHHGSNHMDLTVASRGSVFDGLVQWTYWIIPPLLGIPLIHLLVVKFFTSPWGIFNHTRLVGRLGWLDSILATPANHRVHHGRQAKYLDRNYGQVTVLFDRAFGSFQREEEEPDYGLVTRVESLNPLTHHLVGFRWLWTQILQAPDWQSRLAYLVKPPGWSHDGQHTTTADLVAAAQGPDGTARSAGETGPGPGDHLR